jgi:hypothetical protein
VFKLLERGENDQIIVADSRPAPARRFAPDRIHIWSLETLRRALYIRVSTDQGLEQEFNGSVRVTADRLHVPSFAQTRAPIRQRERATRQARPHVFI